MWSIELAATGEMIGGCGIVWPEGWPRHELTWWIIPAARRHGYAREASQAAIRWAYDTLGWDTVETHMNDSNDAARQLVRALGGIECGRERFPDGLTRSIYRLPRPD
jgi:RimJ/RimL family protein N-acetyltransferase